MAKTIEQVYRVGIYCRLSKDDGTDNESASIATQKSILTEYVKKQGWHLTKTYVDDGYSGTNFQRPNFQNMVKDIENGLINCVITKDLSRLGRNYLDCGLYLEVFFPEHNVRYIAVNDGVDTLNKSAMDITPFRNILNEMYSADVSVKIKSAYRARFNQGKFMGTSAPYGYVKDPADHNHLLIDDKVAHVVREIFDLALAGNGLAKIRKHLNAQHILRPAAYAVERGETGYERHFEDNEDNRYLWSENSVRQILRSPIYAGNLVGYKRITANMKSKKRPSKLPEEWEVIPDTHEGIVTQVEVYRYVTEQTFDAYLYQLVESKQKFISQIMTSKSPVRSAEDVDEVALSFAEVKMLATGDERFKEKMDLDMQVAKLKVLKQSYLSGHYDLEDRILKHYPQQIKDYEERITAYGNPFYGKIICGECGRAFGRKTWSNKGVLRKVWQCNARYEVKGVQGCSNRHIEENTLEQIFIIAWNTIIDNIESCKAKWTVQANGDDLLTAYRARDFLKLTENMEHIDNVDTDFIIRVLDNITIYESGDIIISFYDGTKIEYK